ncbi:MAG: protein kinase [Pirellulaceae bacterium]
MSGSTERGAQDQTEARPKEPDGTKVLGTSPGFTDADLDFAEISNSVSEDLKPGSNIGGYEVVRKIGQGGMGAVYLTRRSGSDAPVALKVLARSMSSRPDAIRRFHKEASTLAKVKSPYIIRLIETGEVDGLHFIAGEFISGGDAGKYIKEFGVPPIQTGQMIFRHIAHAINAMHLAGMIHRDVKPENILLEFDSPQVPTAKNPPTIVTARLSDFGLARMMDQTQSMQITRSMMVMGTPRYMPPEQFASTRDADARADIYSLGATMYFLLTGSYLFAGDDIVSLAHSHRSEGYRPAHLANRSISPALSRILDRCLEKLPENRYQTAAELLAELERLESGQPLQATTANSPVATREEASGTYRFEWDFGPKPESMWPYVSHTDRINRALGLPPATFTKTVRDGQGVVTMAEANFAGMKMRWREHPFTWVENREMTIFREFESGPFQWVLSHVELHPLAGGGTHLIHRFDYRARSGFGKLFAKFQIGVMTRRKLDKIYRRIAAQLEKYKGSPQPQNVMEEPVDRSPSQEAAFGRAAEWLQTHNVESQLVQDIGRFLETGFDTEVSRIQPRVLARRLERDERQVIDASILGVPAGMFLLSWDIICPKCRVAAEIRDTLEMIRGHANCQVCQADFAVDLANSVELVFRVHPEIRKTDLRTYCIGGPFHASHVIAQLQLEPGQQHSLELNLAPGEYQVTGPQWIQPALLLVQSGRAEDYATISVVDPPRLSTLKPDHQILTLKNNSNDRVLVRLERSNSDRLALTAARAVTIERFRQYLPDQIVSPEQLTSIAETCVVHARLGGQSGVFAELDERSALNSSCEFLKIAIDAVRSNEGDVVSRFADGVTACFQQADSAIRSAVQLLMEWKQQHADGPAIRIVLHRGPVTLTSIDGQMHHTGAAISHAAQACSAGLVSATDWNGIAMTEAFRNSGANDSGFAADEIRMEKLQLKSTAQPEGESLFLITID